jgi:hypothetical protein
METVTCCPVGSKARRSNSAGTFRVSKMEPDTSAGRFLMSFFFRDISRRPQLAMVA